MVQLDFNNIKPIISLIIPVYNVEAYLDKALNSVVNQTFKDIEVIIINDGSTDNSHRIINEYAKIYPNFFVINQVNKGLANARNEGLKFARGDYIAFMDSDDYIEPNYLEELYNLAVSNNADISYCNYNIYFPKLDTKIYMPFTSRPTVYTKHIALKKLILDITLHYFSWNKLCKRSIFIDNDLRFYDMYFEDISMSPRLFYFADKIAVTDKALYYYTSRNGSILRQMKVKTINDFIKAFGTIRNFLENVDDFERYRNIFWLYSKRAKLVSYCLIFQMHFSKMNFSGFVNNCNCASKDINYFVSKDYASSDLCIPELPYLITEPEKRKNYDIN